MYEFPMIIGVMPGLTVEATAIASALTLGAIGLAVSGVLFLVVGLLGARGGEVGGDTHATQWDGALRHAA